MRTRWIVIGMLKADAQLYGRGLRGRGWWLNWRGRTDWCQPNEFETVEQLEWAVRKRLGFAKLEAVAFASQPPRAEYQQLWVLVKMDTTTLKLNFVRETDLARLYEHPVTQFRQWVPRSVCLNTMKFGTLHEVKIKDWWLKQNPFEKPAGEQDGLF
jgi:hypothetical protein